jgi:alanine racemase
MKAGNARTRATHLIWAEVDLGAIAHNVGELRRVTKPGARLMAVVKADGYGHGAVETARTALEYGAEWLGVARIAEGIRLRAAGLTAPIMVFGFTLPADAGLLAEHGLRQSVYSAAAAAAYSAAAPKGKRIKVHIKVDTGMGRLGLPPAALLGRPADGPAGAELLDEIEAIRRLPGIETEGIFTHFAASDSADKSHARAQFELFLDVLEQLGARGVRFDIRHAANSAAVMDMPDSHLDLVRTGIAIYGLSPSAETAGAGVALRPAMALKARVVQLKAVPAGFTVSYGMTHRTPAATRIATIAAGYADGLSRGLSSRGSMLVHGQRVPIVGRVCMDLTMLDVGAVPDVAPGDEVVVFGAQGGERIAVEEIAGLLGTINYEILCGITSRVPRVYFHNGQLINLFD